MNIEKMREEFETFAVTHVSLKQYSFDKYPADGDEYDAIPLQAAWDAWQASRESLVIELPDADEPGYHSPGHPNQHCAIGFNHSLDQCREAIHEAGVKTK